MNNTDSLLNHTALESIPEEDEEEEADDKISASISVTYEAGSASDELRPGGYESAVDADKRESQYGGTPGEKHSMNTASASLTYGGAAAGSRAAKRESPGLSVPNELLPNKQPSPVANPFPFASPSPSPSPRKKSLGEAENVLSAV